MAVLGGQFLQTGIFGVLVQLLIETLVCLAIVLKGFGVVEPAANYGVVEVVSEGGSSLPWDPLRLWQ